MKATMQSVHANRAGSVWETQRGEDWRDRAACVGKDPEWWFSYSSGDASAAEGRPVCFAANTATIRRLAEHVIPTDQQDTPPWRPHDPARLFAVPLFVDDDLPDDVIEPRTTYPTRPTEETAP